MTVSPETITPRNPIAYYGWLHATHGIFLQVDGQVSFRESSTETWQTVDRDTLTQFACLNGRCDIADLQAMTDGDKVYRCSRTLTARQAA